VISPRLLGLAAGRVPGLRRLPVFKLIALAELALLARTQLRLLTPDERLRLAALVRKGRGRSSRLTPEEREELSGLVARVEPRRFAGLALDRLSPVPLPRRFTHGRGKPGAS
jgi:hypothetical protein